MSTKPFSFYSWLPSNLNVSLMLFNCKVALRCICQSHICVFYFSFFIVSLWQLSVRWFLCNEVFKQPHLYVNHRPSAVSYWDAALYHKLQISLLALKYSSSRCFLWHVVFVAIRSKTRSLNPSGCSVWTFPAVTSRWRPSSSKQSAGSLSGV